MVTGEIYKIDQLKSSEKNQGQVFVRVYFEISDGMKKSWFKTDLVPTFRNYSRWKNFLKVGSVLGNLIVKNRDTIDADSYPVLVKMKP